MNEKKQWEIRINGRIIINESNNGRIKMNNNTMGTKETIIILNNNHCKIKANLLPIKVCTKLTKIS
jgi:hypothetical protein